MAHWRKILVPTDFSIGARLALVEALDLAKQFQGRVEVLHVARAAPTYVAGGIVPETYVADFREREQAQADLVQWLNDTRGATQVEGRVVIGDPVREIVAAATTGRYDLIIMGTHGRTGLTRLLMGSVAEGVLRHAPCHVLTVHTREQRSAKRAEVHA
jgi:nucleotide-binding universal stress UspA family protein